MDGAHVLPLHGELTIQNAADLRRHLSASVAALPGPPAGATLVLDLSDVSELDSAGVQLLLALRHSLRQRNMGLRLASVSRAVLDVFKTLGLDRDAMLVSACASATGAPA